MRSTTDYQPFAGCSSVTLRDQPQAWQASSLSGRVSFNVAHNAEPPAGVKRTDTLTKLSLVYGS